MRAVRHWTPRYIVNRAYEEFYCRTNPDRPWLTPQANSIIESALRPTDCGLEFGSGRSTVWLARRLHHLTSVEHNPAWYNIISNKITNNCFGNVEYLLRSETGTLGNNADSDYARTALQFDDKSLDFVLVDGICRDHCARLALPKIRSGGFLVIDNVERYLPSDSRSPNSRTQTQGADGPVWSEVMETLKAWRGVWTSSAVWDTAIYFKP